MPSDGIATWGRVLLTGAVSALVAAAAACADPHETRPVAVPPLPAGEARIWIYRDYQPSESLNLAAVSINGALTGYAQAAGGAFYRDVPPGHYHVAVASYGTDTGQSSDIDLAVGQEAYVKIESLSSWATGPNLTAFRRDTFYARLIPAQLARNEIAHIAINAGS